MSRIVIASLTIGIALGFVLSLDPIGLDVVHYYTQADRSDLNELILSLGVDE